MSQDERPCFFSDESLPAATSKVVIATEVPADESSLFELRKGTSVMLSVEPLNTQSGTQLTLSKRGDATNYVQMQCYWTPVQHIHWAAKTNTSPLHLPLGPNQGGIGSSGNSWAFGFFDLPCTVLGTTITAAATIVPTKGMHPLSGTTAISTITVPLSGTFVGSIILLPDAAAQFNTGGNIAKAFTATANVPVLAVCDGTTWYIK